MAVLIETSVGDIILDLFVKECPIATKNFLKLCKIKYYNGCIFHNVQKDYLIQTGDPSGTGKGGESVYGVLYGEQAKYFEDEFVHTLRHDKVGLVSMANMGTKNTNGSQFFITTGAPLRALNDNNTIFGSVAEGMDTVLKINDVYADSEGRPYRIIRIRHTIVLEDPFDDPTGLEVPDKSPERVLEIEDRLEEHEQVLPDNDQDTISDVVKKKQEKLEARSRAEVLEMIGDLPVADIKPPDDVLFVCKLNPITEDDDLHLIFSRFGEIEKCEVIRDPKSGDSLCYAFIEFVDEKSCERAYFKMDNVLIDDRRIHVDFSQSVAKMKQKFGIYETGFFGKKYRHYVEAMHGGDSTDRKNRRNALQRRRIAPSQKVDTRGYNLLFKPPTISTTDTQEGNNHATSSHHHRHHRHHHHKGGRRSEGIRHSKEKEERHHHSKEKRYHSSGRQDHKKRYRHKRHRIDDDERRVRHHSSDKR